MRVLRKFTFTLAVVLLSATFSEAGDPLALERGTMRAALRIVSKDIQNNFYDSELRGLDWPALTEAARKEIDNATTYNDMVVAIFRLVQKLDDSHTSFVPPGVSTRVRYGFDAKPYGNQIRVYDVRGAAYKAGLQVGDTIIQINAYTPVTRENWEDALIYSRSLMPVSPLPIVVDRGGSRIRILIEPDIRHERRIDGMDWRLFSGLMFEADDWDEQHRKFVTARLPSGESQKNAYIGYIDIRSFPDQADRFLGGVLESVSDANAIIIDLRDCPGGAVDTTIKFLGHFEQSETTVASMQARSKTTPLITRPRKPNFRVPLIVLTDSTTGSGGEVVARHLQQHHRATVIGDHTWGGVSVGKFFKEEIGARLIFDFGVSIAIARFELAGGEALEKRGVIPDIPCIPSQDDTRARRDPCLDLALKDAQNAISTKAKTETTSK